MNRRPIMHYKFTNVPTISVKQPLPYLRDKGDFYQNTHTTGPQKGIFGRHFRRIVCFCWITNLFKLLQKKISVSILNEIYKNCELQSAGKYLIYINCTRIQTFFNSPKICSGVQERRSFHSLGSGPQKYKHSSMVWTFPWWSSQQLTLFP